MGVLTSYYQRKDETKAIEKTVQNTVSTDSSPGLIHPDARPCALSSPDQSVGTWECSLLTLHDAVCASMAGVIMTVTRKRQRRSHGTVIRHIHADRSLLYC